MHCAPTARCVLPMKIPSNTRQIVDCDTPMAERYNAFLRNGVHSAALGSGTAALRCTQGNTVALLHLLNTACAAMMVGIDVGAR